MDVFLPCSGDEAVEQRVCQAVHARYRSANLVNTEEPFKALAAIQQHADQGSNMDRSEADQQAEQNHRQQLWDPQPFLIHRGSVGFHCQACAPAGEKHDENRNHEAQEEASDASISHGLRQREEDVVAQRERVVLIVGVLPGYGAHIEAHHQHPNGDGGHGGGADLPHPGVPERMDHRQVAVHSDAAEESLTGVEVGVEWVDGGQTDVASMGPDASPQEVHPQGKAKGEGQVTQGQMEEVNAKVVLLPDVLTRHVQGEGVCRDGDDDDGQVVEEEEFPPEGRFHRETAWSIGHQRQVLHGRSQVLTPTSGGKQEEEKQTAHWWKTFTEFTVCQTYH